MCAGIGRKGSGESGAQQVFAGARLEEQLFVGGQAGGVGEEHVERDVAAAGIGFAALVGHKFRDDAGYGNFEFEQAALIEDHRHRRGGDNFGKRRQVEESGRLHFRIPALWHRTRQGWGTLPRIVTRWIGLVDETTQGFEGDETIPVCDGDGGCGKGASGNGCLQNCEGGRKVLVLMVESWDESWRRMVQGLCAREKNS